MTKAVAPLSESVYQAFPSPLHAKLAGVVAVLGPSELDRNTSLGDFTVTVGQHVLRIPERVYTGEPSEEGLASLDHLQKTALACWLSRHHDGRIRQRCLEVVIAAEQDWVVPYVVRLVGEYVVEILEVIDSRLREQLERSGVLRQHYMAFVRANPGFIELTRQRVLSYWDCYYRSRWPKSLRLRPNYTDYPGFRVMELIGQLPSVDRLGSLG